VKNAGVTVDEGNVERIGAGGAVIRSGPDQVIAVILGTRQGAAESGYQLLSTRITFTRPAHAVALHDRRSMRSRALIPPAEARRLS
jgi:hypothetical protein